LSADDDVDGRFTHWRRNFLLLTLDSTIFMTAVSLSDVTILSVFMVKATGSTLLAGLFQMIRITLFFLPQLLSINIGGKPYKKSIFTKWTTLGRSCLLIAILVTFFTQDLSLIVLSYFVSFSLFPLFDGFTVVPWLEFVVKSIPPTNRGTFFGLGQGTGAVGMIASGFLASILLNAPNLEFPRNYGMIVLVEAVLMLVGVLFLLFLREVPDAPTLDATSLLDRIKGIPRIIREDATIRRLILIQLLLSCYSLSTPFYSLFAVTQLGVDDGLIGHFLVYQTAGRLAASYPWAYLCNRAQNKKLLQSAGFMMLLSLLLALFAGASHAANAEGTTLILPVMFFLYGASISGTFLGFNNYVMGLSDGRYRPVLLGMMNALYIVTSILPVLGGIIVEFLPYELLFLTSIVPVGGSLLLTHGLRQKLE
jgi:MFS family permease